MDDIECLPPIQPARLSLGFLDQTPLWQELSAAELPKSADLVAPGALDSIDFIHIIPEKEDSAIDESFIVTAPDDDDGMTVLSSCGAPTEVDLGVLHVAVLVPELRRPLPTPKPSLVNLRATPSPTAEPAPPPVPALPPLLPAPVNHSQTTLYLAATVGEKQVEPIQRPRAPRTDSLAAVVPAERRPLSSAQSIDILIASGSDTGVSDIVDEIPTDVNDAADEGSPRRRKPQPPSPPLAPPIIVTGPTTSTPLGFAAKFNRKLPAAPIRVPKKVDVAPFMSPPPFTAESFKPQPPKPTPTPPAPAPAPAGGTSRTKRRLPALPKLGGSSSSSARTTQYSSSDGSSAPTKFAFRAVSCALSASVATVAKAVARQQTKLIRSVGALPLFPRKKMWGARPIPEETVRRMAEAAEKRRSVLPPM